MKLTSISIAVVILVIAFILSPASNPHLPMHMNLPVPLRPHRPWLLGMALSTLFARLRRMDLLPIPVYIVY